MEITNVLKQPVLTEKTLRLAGEENVYTFAVDKKANKHQVKAAVEDQFKVEVIGIRIISQPGKTKRRGAMRRRAVKLPGKKKALVKLKEGEKIALFDIGG